MNAPTRNLLVLARKGDSQELSVAMQPSHLPGDVCLRLQPGQRITIEIEPVAAPSPLPGLEVVADVPPIPSLRGLRGGQP